jgi:hypothetical protein
VRFADHDDGKAKRRNSGTGGREGAFGEHAESVVAGRIAIGDVDRAGDAFALALGLLPLLAADGVKLPEGIEDVGGRLIIAVPIGGPGGKERVDGCAIERREMLDAVRSEEPLRGRGASLRSREGRAGKGKTDSGDAHATIV